MQLQIPCRAEFADIDFPCVAQVRQWSTATLQEIGHHGGEITVRVVGESEMCALNQRYRGKSGTTNVLAFPFEKIDGLPIDILGDVVICAPVVAEEAASRAIPIMHHWAHMVIHATLHLCGFDHQQHAEAEYMEMVEQKILAGLGISIAPVVCRGK